MDHCFVISPIGDKESPIRKHVDEVLKLIIEPAVEQLGLEPIRSDQIVDTGRITSQMFEAIFESPLLIAILTENNENVLYELALAQCARRPLVMLNREGDRLPFDVRDLRVIRYDGHFHAGKLDEVKKAIVDSATKQLEDSETIPAPSDLFDFWPNPSNRPIRVGCTFEEGVKEIRREFNADGVFSIWSREDDPSIPDFNYLRSIALQKLVYTSTKVWEGRAQSANLWICHDVDSQGRPIHLRSGIRNGYFPFWQLLDKVTLAQQVYFRAFKVDYEREDLFVAAQVVKNNKPVIESIENAKSEDKREQSMGLQWILGIPTSHPSIPAEPGQPLCITVDYLEPIDEASFEEVYRRANTISELLTRLAFKKAVNS